MKTASITILFALAAALSGCGGGHRAEGPPAATDGVPASATASSAAYSQYTGTIAPSDTGEPLDVEKVAPPTSETDEPAAIS